MSEETKKYDSEKFSIPEIQTALILTIEQDKEKLFNDLPSWAFDHIWTSLKQNLTNLKN